MQRMRKEHLVAVILILVGVGLIFSGYLVIQRIAERRQAALNNVVTTIRGVPPPQPHK